MSGFIEIGGDEVIQLIGSTVAEELIGAAFPSAAAESIAKECVAVVLRSFGGTQTYIPRAPHVGAVQGALINPSGRVPLAIEESILGSLKGWEGDRRAVARRCALAVMRMMGCGKLYIPKDSVSRIKNRDAQIWREFTGANYRPLALKFDLSEMRIRQIIKAQQDLQRAARRSEEISKGASKA